MKLFVIKILIYRLLLKMEYLSVCLEQLQVPTASK